jgi:hypothetical protein
MAPPNGYASFEGWWMWTQFTENQSTIFPDGSGGPGWEEGTIPKSIGLYKTGPGQNVQGWKIHVCAFPTDIEVLFKILSEYLKPMAHKFAPFDVYKEQRTGYAAYQLIGHEGGDSAAGKACVIYPSNPRDLAVVAKTIDQLIQRSGTGIRPFPGGVKGDLALGSTGFVYCRYGAFWGKLATDNLLYDPIEKKTCKDPRFTSPYPAFIKYIPNEINSVRRG